MNPFGDLARPIIDRPGMFAKDPVKVERSKRAIRIIAESTLPKESSPWGLSAAQCEMLRRLCDGQGNQEIADAIGLTIAGVEASLARAREKMGANNRTHMAVLWDRFARKAAA